MLSVGDSITDLEFKLFSNEKGNIKRLFVMEK
jgi:hypothetical protein